MSASETASPGPGGSLGLLMDALRRLLRPLVRLAISHGLTFPALAELLKQTYVETAASDFVLADKGQTDSRVSLLTGVHRKDVRRLRQAGATEAQAAMPKSVSLGAQIAAAWSSRGGYIDASGNPLALPRSAAAGEPSFDALVQSVSKDIRSRVLLDEWIRLGVAEIDQAGLVQLTRAAFVPVTGLPEKSFYLGQNIHDHIATIAHNFGDGVPFLERCVHYENVSLEDVADLARLAETHGMRALRAVNARVADERRTVLAGSWRMNFGIYFYAEPVSGQSEPRVEP